MTQLRTGDRIGIIGGGQLARMLAMAAARLGYKVCVLDPDKNCPASSVSDQQICASYDDRDALHEMVKRTKVITYEFENINWIALKEISEFRNIYPPVSALEISQDRFLEKSFFKTCGIKTAPWYAINSLRDLEFGITQSGGEAVLKTRRLGYDGHGQIRITAYDQAKAVQNLIEAPLNFFILESFVEFEKEISVIGARSRDGSIKAFDLIENVHRDGILRQSRVPAGVSDAVAAQAVHLLQVLLEAFNYVGVLALELFLLPSGELLANEFAPRVHNTGHWTETACVVSQFEQHVRAVAGLPLGESRRHSNAIMTNLIGSDVSQVSSLFQQSDVSINLYGKEIIRDGRKMGHFTKILPLKAFEGNS